MRVKIWHLPCIVGGLLAILSGPAAALDIVSDGKPLATIVAEGHQDKAPPIKAKGKGKGKAGRKGLPQYVSGDLMAAQVLADWIRKITGAEVPISETAPPTGVVIYVGGAAVKAGLKIDDIESPTHEGLRIVCDGQRILLAGQDGTSTVKAACRLLEEMGCRYYMDSPLGEVYPHAKTLSVKEMDLRAKPGFDMREIWGSNWSGSSLWKIWNGAGGLPLPMGHAWGRYVSQALFQAHPEYFALRNGQRKQGDWYCTSNPALRKIFADGVISALAESGGIGASISPPDGVGYCECDKCRAQDDPKSIEPSSGRVSVTDRYGNHYTSDYLRRFIGKQIAAIATSTAAPSHVVQVLPDTWRLEYDPDDKGATLGYGKPEFIDSSWKPVATFSDTLDSQGLPDRKTIMWYRTSFDLPTVKGKPSLLFIEVDGNATVFINGKEAGASAKKRIPFEVDGAALQPGRNTIAVRVDHSAISELFLGGIIRPIYVVEKPAK